MNDPKENQLKQIIEENGGRINSICCYYCPNAVDQKDMGQGVLANIWKSALTSCLLLTRH